MTDGPGPKPVDPFARRVAGAFLLLVAVGILLVVGPFRMGESVPVTLLAVAVAGGLGAGGLNLLVWPEGRRRRS